MKKSIFEKVSTYIVSAIFGIIVLYLTAIRLFSICTIDDREITHYLSDNIMKNILIIIAFIVLICVMKSLRSKGKMRRITDENAMKLLKVVAIIFTVFCAWVVVATQLWPKADQLYVLGIASEFRSHSYVSWANAGYMYKYPNQNGFVVFIYLMSKIIGDYNNIGLQLSNVVALVGAYLCIYQMCNLQSENKKLGVTTFIALCLFFPLALYVTFVYGTLWGFFFAMAALLFVNRYLYTGKEYNIFVAAVFISIAALLKNNYSILLIAMVILLVVHAISQKKIFSIAGSILIVAVYVGISGGLDTGVASITGGDVKSGMPSEAWIAMGMQEGSRASGWYNSYHDGIYLSNNFETEATRETAKQDITVQIEEFKSNKAEALAFYSRKIASQWNNPNFECFWIQNNRESKIFMSGTADTVIYGKSDMLNKMLNVFHLLVLAGTSIFVIARFRKNTFTEMQFAIIFIGGFLFHMLWEAKCQYTIVYFVLLIPYAVRGYNIIANKIVGGNMLNKIDWLYHFMRSSIQSKVLVKFLEGDRYTAHRENYMAKVYGKKIVDSPTVNKILLEKLKNNVPFAVCRNGMDETIFLVKMQRDDIIGTHSAEKMNTMPVMFDHDKVMMKKYYNMMNDLYKNADFIVNWRMLNMEDYYYRQFRDNAEFCYDDGVSNFLLKDPDSWIYGLEGKKVMVISPFTEFIDEQYKKKELLWTGIRIPQFELHTVKSVFWYEGYKDPRFNNWYEVLDYIYDEAMKQEFDIALLGCGPLSTPLALKFKKMGKQAVHVGGPLQLMFGIKGKRWDRYFADTYNEHWITLPEDTKAGNVDTLDVKGGSYW